MIEYAKIGKKKQNASIWHMFLVSSLFIATFAVSFMIFLALFGSTEAVEESDMVDLSYK